MMLAEILAVVRRQHTQRVLPQPCLLERIRDLAHAGVAAVNGRAIHRTGELEIGLVQSLSIERVVGDRIADLEVRGVSVS